jgi:hypothetical protein
MRTGQSIEIEDEEEDDWLLAANGERGMANPQRRYADTPIRNTPYPPQVRASFSSKMAGAMGTVAIGSFSVASHLAAGRRPNDCEV